MTGADWLDPGRYQSDTCANSGKIVLIKAQSPRHRSGVLRLGSEGLGIQGGSARKLSVKTPAGQTVGKIIRNETRR